MTPWRYCCPEGHHSLKTRVTKPGYRCDVCQQAYPGDPIDKKHEEVPA